MSTNTTTNTATIPAVKDGAPVVVSVDCVIEKRVYAYEVVAIFRYADYETEKFFDASAKIYLDAVPNELSVKTALQIRSLKSFTSRKVALVYDMNKLAKGENALIRIDAVNEREKNE